MSILLVAVSAERLINFRAKKIFSPNLLARVKPLWLAGDFDKIHELLGSEKNTLGRILNYLLCHRHQQVSVLALGASEIASLELRQHQQKAYALAIVATVAPIVGLLGTVIGMIEAFHVIAYSQGMGNPALLAGGISKALINTAAGLSVALPALAMHHFFKHRSVTFSLLLEQAINQSVNEWFTSTNADSVLNFKVVSHAN
jgi:biopolymer transport protein ExbB